MRRQIGSITELGKNHYKVYITAGVNPETGRQRRKTKTVRGTRRQAEAVLQAMASEYNPDFENTLTLAEYFEFVYLAKARKRMERGRMKLRTIESYEDRMRLHIIPHIGDMRMADIKSHHIRACMDKANTDAMAKEIRKTLSAIMREAADDEVIPYNPALSIKVPETDDYEPDVLDLEDIEVYLWHFRDTRAEAVVLLALGGSYRRGEIAALNVDDIDFETGFVTVDDAYVEARGGTIHESPKNRKARRNRIPPFILSRLKEILPPYGPVISTLTGDRMKPASISQLYERVRDKLPEGVPRIPLKNLRHTSLTMAYDATGDLEAVAGHGGHSKAVSKKHYIREHDDREDRLIDAVDAYLHDRLG